MTLRLIQTTGNDMMLPYLLKSFGPSLRHHCMYVSGSLGAPAVEDASQAPREDLSQEGENIGAVVLHVGVNATRSHSQLLTY